ncbi:hypothetical protein KJA16_01550 [Patescibacteria group bacterium]|nr:hypothetical protein [Patescibacteria group bacterium]
MAIEIIPKKEVKPSPWQNTLLGFLIFLFLISILGYFGLDYFVKKADRQLQELNEEITKARSPQRIALEKEVLDYQEKIEDFSFLLANHQKSSNFFDFLEEITHPEVFFSELNLDTKENRVRLYGQAESFQILGQQLLIFRKAEFIDTSRLSEIRIGEEGKIEFTFDFSLNPKLFTR